MANSDDNSIVSIHQGKNTVNGPIFSQVEAYWNALRNGNSIPLRSQVSPRGIESALRHSFILERIAPGHARFRLAGMYLNELMGMEVRGMPFSAIFTTGSRNPLADALEQVFSVPAMLKLQLTTETGIAKPALSAGLLLLPLKSDLGDVTRALGCLAGRGKTGRAPRRFCIEMTNLCPVSPDMSKAPVPAAAAKRPEPMGFAETGNAFSTKPHLRLVYSADDVER